MPPFTHYALISANDYSMHNAMKFLNEVYTKINPSTPSGQTSIIIIKNLSTIYKGIKISPGIKGGYGLIYTKNNVGIVGPTQKAIDNIPFVRDIRIAIANSQKGTEDKMAGKNKESNLWL